MQAGKPYALMAVMQNGGAAQISIKHGITGPVHTHGSACAAAGAAIGEAARAIRDGYLDIAVAGGAEAPLTGAMFCGFEGARALARVDPVDVGRSCRPFDTRRSGLVLGEGAAFLVLESERHALARGAACLAYLSGYGTSADAHHIAMPFADGQARAIRMALDDAGLDPSQLHYFNAHGTATRGGDPVEASAIRSVFGSGSASVPVSSTKALHGHLLGAAGALECIVAVMAIRRRMLPATAGLEQPDPACMLNHIASATVPNQDIHTAMSLSCGFGGTNVALLVSKYVG
jgi:3-oxoacyl-[acyl-carrier-protein] synthase II